MDIGTGLAIFSGSSVVIAGILKFTPSKSDKTTCGKYVTVREFEIWQKGFDKRWESLEGWISNIHTDVNALVNKVGTRK